MIVAIDGPVGAGKSTVARLVAERLGAAYLDTGAMYRAVALLALEGGVDVDDERSLASRAAQSEIALVPAAAGVRVLVAGRDVTDAIRTPEVSAATSRVARHAAVRAQLVARQQEIMRTGDWVADGRDIGTVVCPGAELKVFLTADPAERARRRHRDLEVAGDPRPIEEVARDLAERDARDAGREVAPLVAAADAVVLDTTGRGIDEVVTEIERRAREAMA